MGSKFYGKKKATDVPTGISEPRGAMSDSELDAMLNAALDDVAPLISGNTADKTISPVITQEEIKAIPIEKTIHKAYNTYYDGVAKKFLLITIEYDPSTDQCGMVTKEPIADNIAVALYKLNGIITNKLMRGEESV